MEMTDNKTYRPPLITDFPMLMVTLLLVAFSLVMVYSTTGVVSEEKFGDEFFYVKRQGIAAAVGIALMFLFSRVKIDSLKKISPHCYWIAFFMLLLPILPGIGDRAGGASRWAGLGPIRFQPGEFVKLFFIIFLSGYFSRHDEKIAGFVWGMVKPLIFAGALGVLFLLQPDFGSTAVLIIVTIAMATAAGVRLRYIIGCGALSVCAMGTLVALSPYRMQRVVSFLSPFEDVSGKGYQLIQSLIAVGTGRFTGVGLGGSQQKLFFLPAAHTDFIFSVVAEELGFVGACALICAFLIFLWRGMSLAVRVSEDTFSYCLAIGLTLVVVIPALLNVGVTTGVLPTKGLVLPLVGYGGSSIVASLLGVGILLALWRDIYMRQR